ncbi:MAG TPA: FKBP-type peptidyl-prolyl cis-trans isomerase [Draconibacterium sp.]|nr:FKBP-type peptidyl-prolyl cis-trans isomerase [Draconibacterium sp.]
MSLKLIKRFLLALIIGGTVMSCMKENENPFVPPTKAEETALLNEYLDSIQNWGMDIDTTGLGVYYVTDSIGNGVFPVFGDTCVVSYTGFFINGQTFDQGSADYEFVLGNEVLIDGWNDGMRMIDKEGRAYLIIPSDHAYGISGVQDYYGNYLIPPNTTVVFYVEMVDIKPYN